MKILFLANANSTHTIKWARSLAENNIEVLIFSLEKELGDYYKNHKNIKVISVGSDLKISGSKTLPKLFNIFKLPYLKKIIKKFKPDILHAHYASSYGFLGALTKFHPFITSFWGSDIYIFPKRSFINKLIIKYVLVKSDKVLSTSKIMAEEILKYMKKKKEIFITPFGVNIEKFKPKQVSHEFLKKDAIVIGTIKTLDKIYGIEYLIKAFHILYKKYPHLPLKLMIVGGGPQESKLRCIVKDLSLQNITLFTGYINYESISGYHNMLSIFVALSKSESFGVSVLEASACEKPVVVSNVGGLPEVVEDGVTGFVVPAKDPKSAAQAVEKLILNEKLSKEMGQRGRARVKKLYNWDDSVKKMINIYKKFK